MLRQDNTTVTLVYKPHANKNNDNLISASVSRQLIIKLWCKRFLSFLLLNIKQIQSKQCNSQCALAYLIQCLKKSFFSNQYVPKCMGKQCTWSLKAKNAYVFKEHLWYSDLLLHP